MTIRIDAVSKLAPQDNERIGRKPWKKGGCSGRMIFDAANSLIADVDIMAHTDHILRAVNCHDDLLEALIEVDNAMMDIDGYAGRCGTWEVIQAAIAKARGSA